MALISLFFRKEANVFSFRSRTSLIIIQKNRVCASSSYPFNKFLFTFYLLRQIRRIVQIRKMKLCFHRRAALHSKK
jgi:hypothetical protein